MFLVYIQIFKIERVEHSSALNKEKSHKNGNEIAFFCLCLSTTNVVAPDSPSAGSEASLEFVELLLHDQHARCKSSPLSAPWFPLCCLDCNIPSSFFSFPDTVSDPQLNLLQKQPHVEKFPLPHSFATLCCTKENVVLIPRVLNYISFTLIISFGALAQASGDKEEAEWHIPSFTQNYPPI